jgi:hypothetical protein
MSGEVTMDSEQEVIIETTAPIPFEELKKYFQNDKTRYIVDVENSELQGTKLLTYLGNLDIPIDIQCNNNKELLMSLVKEYLHFDQIVSIPSLEDVTLGALYLLKGLDENGLNQFVEDNFEILQKWERRIDQLMVYNLHTIQHPEYNEWISELPVDEDDSREGINFISLMKYPALYGLIGEAKEENKLYNPTFFNESIFKGNNLFFYWAHEQNPIFLFWNAIVTGELSGKEYARIVATTDDIPYLND